MFRVAILQSDREAIRAGYVEILPALAAQPELAGYVFRAFDTSNLDDLFGVAANDLIQFDALFIGTNATSEQLIIQALQREREKIAAFLSSGRGLFVGSQKKLSQRFQEDDANLRDTGFLPAQLEISFVERPLAEADSGLGRIREALPQPLTTATSSDLLLTFPRRVKASDVEAICKANRFRRHFYRSMLRPAFPAAYDTLLLDEKVGIRRDLLIASSGRTGLARVVASTIVLDWELHTDLLVNIVRFITEGKPAFAFFNRGDDPPGDYQYILDSAGIAKISHVCYDGVLPNTSDPVVQHHETLVFAPGWSEAEVLTFRRDLIAADQAASARTVRRRLYHVLGAFDGLPTRLVQTTTLSAVDRECDEGIAALKPRVKDGLWEGSFWTTYDVLMLLQQRGGDVASFIEETVDAIKPHLASGSYDSVMAASCATLELRYACDTGTFGYSDRVKAFGEGWPQTLSWILQHFEEQSPYDQMTAALAVARLARNSQFQFPEGTRGLDRVANWRPLQSGTSELDLIRELELYALTGQQFEQRSEKLDLLLQMQSAHGAWADERRTALVCDVLARVVRGSVRAADQQQEVDAALFKAVSYLRSLRLAASQDAEPLASALALRAIDSFNRAVPISTQDFLPEISRSAGETVQGNALTASSHYIDECLRQITELKRRVAANRDEADASSRGLDEAQAELRRLGFARRKDLAVSQRWRLMATIGASVALGLIGSLALFHLETLRALATEMGSILALMVSAVVGAIAGMLMQRPEASDPQEMQVDED